MKIVLELIRYLFSDYLVAQLISTGPMSYLIGELIELSKGGEFMDATLPTYFWGILSILLIAVTFNRAWVLPFKKWRLEADKRRLEADKMWRDKIESAYSYISKVHKPKILNQAKLGNQDFMKEVAQNEIDLIRPLLVRKYGENNVPRKIDINDATSITVWYEFFRDERVKHLE